VQNGQRGRARGHVSAWVWADWARISPTLFTLSPFLFQNNFRNPWKNIKNPKIVKPIFLGFLFSLEFNKNSFMIFSLNREF
jgi:hypothetical protein